MNSDRPNTQAKKPSKETQKFRNVKYRRKRNFIKKGLQFSQICGLDVIIFTLDRKLNKLHEFYTSADFKLNHIN